MITNLTFAIGNLIKKKRLSCHVMNDVLMAVSILATAIQGGAGTKV